MLQIFYIAACIWDHLLCPHPEHKPKFLKTMHLFSSTARVKRCTSVGSKHIMNFSRWNGTKCPGKVLFCSRFSNHHVTNLNCTIYRLKINYVMGSR